jgi:Cu/Ag efflux pump CusA
MVVRIFGPDQAELRATADRLKTRVAGIAGVADLKVESQVLVPQIQIRPRPADMATLGLTPGEVRRQAQSLIAGQKLGEIYRDQKAFDVAIWGEPAIRDDLHALRDLMIQTPTGTPVRLRDIADVRIQPAPNEVTGSIEHGRTAHEAIAGSSWTAMDDIGHFGMSENPNKFLEYILPVLDRVRQESAPAKEKATA